MTLSILHEMLLPSVREAFRRYGWCGVMMCNCQKDYPSSMHGAPYDDRGPRGGQDGFDYNIEYIRQLGKVSLLKECDLPKLRKHRDRMVRPFAIKRWSDKVAEAEEELRRQSELLDLLLTLPIRMHVWESDQTPEWMYNAGIPDYRLNK